MKDRKAYFQAYAAANRERRKEANRRWREKNRLAYNANQKANNERWRRAHGMKARAVPQPQPEPEAKPISVPREIVGLSARFAAYRAATKAA